MFTKICKVVLWLWIIGGITASIVVGVHQRTIVNSSGFFSHSKTVVSGVGYLIIFGGILATIATSALFGMVIEISENTKASRDYLYELRSRFGQQETQNYDPGEMHKVGTALQKLSAINNGGNAEQIPEFWFCTQCGTKNDRLSSSCKGCGKYK